MSRIWSMSQAWGQPFDACKSESGWHHLFPPMSQLWVTLHTRHIHNGQNWDDGDILVFINKSKSVLDFTNQWFSMASSNHLQKCEQNLVSKSDWQRCILWDAKPITDFINQWLSMATSFTHWNVSRIWSTSQTGGDCGIQNLPQT